MNIMTSGCGGALFCIIGTANESGLKALYTQGIFHSSLYCTVFHTPLYCSHNLCVVRGLFMAICQGYSNICGLRAPNLLNLASFKAFQDFVDEVWLANLQINVGSK